MESSKPGTIERTLFDAYNNYKRNTLYYKKLRSNTPYLKELKATPQRLALFKELAEWCKAKDILPNQWLYTLFAARYWKYPPKLERAHLMSEKHIKRFHKFSNWDAYAALQDKPAPIFDPNKDLSNSVETLKKYFLENNIETCLERMQKDTYGYHPLSKVCEICTIQIKCREVLTSSVNFDIIALRRGELEMEDAKQLALLGVLDYGKRK